MVEYIEYQGERLPIRVGYYALKHTISELEKVSKTKENITMETLLAGDIGAYEPLLWYSLQMGARATGVELKYKREEVEFILDECMFQFIEILPKFFPGEKQIKAGE